MYLVYIGHRKCGGDAPASWVERPPIGVESLDQVKIEHGGHSIKVTVLGPEGQLLGCWCGPEVQVRVVDPEVM